jgi:uncharacterized protein YndB with AHSA1/START domain
VHKQVLKIEKNISSDPKRLFQAWLKAEELSQWFLSKDTTHSCGIESATLDPRPGGRFQINMLIDGMIYPHEGEYLVVEEPTKLVFTWKSHATNHENTLVTITFTALPDLVISQLSGEKRKPQTRITLVHERLVTREQIDMHTMGWTHILNHLATWQEGITNE